MATTSVLAALPASAITFRTSAALLALHATSNASSQQDSFKNASTWGSQFKGSANHGASTLRVVCSVITDAAPLLSSTSKYELHAAARMPQSNPTCA